MSALVVAALMVAGLLVAWAVARFVAKGIDEGRFK